MATKTDTAEQTNITQLRSGSVGFIEVLFQSLTYISPGTSLALVLPFVVVFAGGALPLTVILIFIGCFATAWLLGEMSAKLPSSGGMFTYIANGLGPNAGYMAGWLYVMCLLADLGGIYLLLAGFVAAQLKSSFGWDTTLTWVIVTLAIAAFVTFNGLRRASRGTRLGSILGMLEVAAFAILSFWLIVKAGARNTLSVFTTHFANAPHYHGFSGIIAAAVLTILAYQGFESAVVLGEEAKRPHVSVKTGMLVSVIAILIYFVLATYASTVFYGPSKMASFSSYGNGAPWDQLARDAWGAGWIIIFLAIVNSVTACANACNIATTRTLFSMSRAGVLHRELSKTNRQQVPGPAQIITTGIALASALVTAIIWGPTVAATFLLTITSAIIILLYIVSAVTCNVLFLKRYRQDFSMLRHALPMLIVVVGFVPALLSTFGVRIFRFVSPLAWPENMIAPLILAWFVVGAGVGAYVSKSRARGLTGIGELYSEGAGNLVEPVAVNPSSASLKESMID